jgi:REP element-mobilizing transposase RayT
LNSHILQGLAPDRRCSLANLEQLPGVRFLPPSEHDARESGAFDAGSLCEWARHMARPLRIQAAGLTYHVTARGVRHTSIYLNDADRRRFLALLADVVERYDLRCHAYCQMTNHYHLAITTMEANLSRAVHQLNGAYARWWNTAHRRVGHVFQARFYAQVIQDDAYLANVCRYIVLNPVRAEMVHSPEQWPWSSYRAMVGLARLPRYLDCERLLDSITPHDPEEATKRFQLSVSGEDACAWRLPRSAVLGDDEFIRRLQATRVRISREVPRREGRRALATIFEGAITRAARNAAIRVAVDERYALSDIARHLDVHLSTVSRIARHGARPCEMCEFKT